MRVAPVRLNLDLLLSAEVRVRVLVSADLVLTTLRNDLDLFPPAEVE